MLPSTLRKLKWRIKRASNLHRSSGQPDIAIFSSPRSGSTWLMEIVATQPGFKSINEPFLMTRFEGLTRPLSPNWELLLPGAERETILERYFASLLNNELGIGSPSPFMPQHRWRTDRMVFKILRCKDMINWFEEKFGLKVIFLLRHPLAVSLSRKACPQLRGFLDNDVYCDRYLTPALRRYGNEVLEEGTELDRKILDWCLQHRPPLLHLDRSRWLCLHYEDLTMRPQECIGKLAAFLELDGVERMDRQLGVPSRSTFLSDRATRRHLKRNHSGTDPRFLVEKWRDRVDPEEERQSMEIVKTFGLDQYRLGDAMPHRRL